jgi:hypothetical protein
MNKPTYINCADDGGILICAGNTPDETDGKAALMANPGASAAVLIDAAFTRAARIQAITEPFSLIRTDSLDLPRDTIQNLLSAINGMGHEVARLLEAAQSKQAEANHD